MFRTLSGIAHLLATTVCIAKTNKSDLFLSRNADCAGQPGCLCGATRDDCSKCVASSVAPGNPEEVTLQCQANCFQPGSGYCGAGLLNFCTCADEAPPAPSPTPAPSTPSPGFIFGSDLGQCGGNCYRVFNTCQSVLGLSYGCEAELLGDLAPKLANFCSQTVQTKIAFGHKLPGMECGDCALIRVQNDEGVPTPFQEVCMFAVDVGSGEVSDQSLLLDDDALCSNNADCVRRTRVDYEWKKVDCATCAP